jgi:hypothetical protein
MEHNGSENCFVIMPISDHHEYEADHFRDVYDDLIKPSVIKSGYKPVRADEIKNSNFIHLDIFQHLLSDRMAICDISSRNPNVFYELAFRQAHNLPTVLLKDEKTTSPFDISGIRYIEYKSHLRASTINKASEEICDFIANSKGNPNHNSIPYLLGATKNITNGETTDTFAEKNVIDLINRIDVQYSETKSIMYSINNSLKIEEIIESITSLSRGVSGIKSDINRILNILNQTNKDIKSKNTISPRKFETSDPIDELGRILEELRRTPGTDEE